MRITSASPTTASGTRSFGGPLRVAGTYVQAPVRRRGVLLSAEGLCRGEPARSRSHGSVRRPPPLRHRHSGRAGRDLLPEGQRAWVGGQELPGRAGPDRRGAVAGNAAPRPEDQAGGLPGRWRAGVLDARSGCAAGRRPRSPSREVHGALPRRAGRGGLVLRPTRVQAEGGLSVSGGARLMNPPLVVRSGARAKASQPLKPRQAVPAVDARLFPMPAVA